MTARRIVIVASLGALVAAAPAHAAWTPPDIVSVDNARQEQADSATLNVQIADGGRYVVMQTRATNFFADDDPDPPGVARSGGIFRYDRYSGAIDLVADGDFVTRDGTTTLRGASNPSISADGRFVVFQTAQRLTPADTNDNTDVYVRDMSVPVGSDRQASGAYTLVDAVDGAATPATYARSTSPQAAGDPGATVAPGVAISDDGTKVAFRTAELASNLPSGVLPTTPGGNVFVRDLADQRTTLVSRAMADGSPAGGAAPGVALSRDGTTVVWTGQNAPQQTPFLNGEVADTGAFFYLWRRWDDPGATTRRITGIADPDDPGCPPDGTVDRGTTATGPCEGPLTDTEQGLSAIQGLVPSLSANGYRVAFLAAGALRPQPSFNSGLDLFVTDMSPGVSRKAGTRELTRDPVSGSPRAGSPIDGAAISADGRRIVFATSRTQFLLPTPTFVDTPRSTGTGDELYAIDLATNTMDRVVRSAAGGDQSGGELPRFSLDADGSTVAFLSDSGNLISGDANATIDAFTSSLAPPVAPPGALAGAGLRPKTTTIVGGGSPELSVSPRRRKDGGLDLRITAPGSGRVAAVATAAPKKKTTAKTSKSKSKAKARAKTKPKTSSGGTGPVLANAKAKVPATRKATLALIPRGTAKTAVAHHRTVKVRIAVTFTPATGKARKRTLAATFAKPKAAATKPSKAKGKRGSRSQVVPSRRTSGDEVENVK